MNEWHPAFLGSWLLVGAGSVHLGRRLRQSAAWLGVTSQMWAGLPEAHFPLGFFPTEEGLRTKKKAVEVFLAS
jgi:hypothetical protein